MNIIKINYRKKLMNKIMTIKWMISTEIILKIMNNILINNIKMNVKFLYFLSIIFL